MGGPEKWQKRGRAKWVLSHFVVRKNNFGILCNRKERNTFKFSFTSGDFLLLIPPYLFTVHIRPVLSPYQAGNTCCILSCFFKYVYNIVNTICTHNMYIALCLAPLFLFGITGFCLTFYCTNIVL